MIRPTHRHAFTRTELLAISATVLIFLLFVLPSTAKARDRSKSAVCASNLRHLIIAWQLYADAHGGRLVGNFGGAEATGAGSNPRNAPWASGWLDWGLSPANTNMLYLRESRFARLGDYISTPENVHKCPADIYQSNLQRSLGRPRVRTVVMNGTLGEGNGMTGPWDPLYRQTRSLSDLTRPSPAETTVIFDEHPDSLNDPFFYAPTGSGWIDFPGNLHHSANSFSFADGHVALHRWRSATIRNSRVTASAFVISAAALPGDSDISWMSYHSQRSRDEHY